MSSLFDENTTWTEFGRRHLDPRVTKALTMKLGLERPTIVQSQGIPVSLEGKDLLCRARTGSGKTLCYAVPMVQRLLAMAEAKGTAAPLAAVVLVPTKELVIQVHGVITQLLTFCFDVLTAEYLLSGQKYAKAELPTVLVTTPSSLLALVQQKRGTMLPLAELLKILVVDEADLMFSFGYEDDMREMCALLPATYQAMLVSATLSEEVEQLKGLMLHKPVTLKLEEPRVTGKLSQFYFVCKKGDKYLILYTLIKLQLLQGKKLMFVKNMDSAYRFKIFFEKFGINSAVVNSEMPHSSRQNIVQSFNQSLIDMLIATDAGVAASGLADEDAPEDPEDEEEAAATEEKPKKRVKTKKVKRKAEAEPGDTAEEPAKDGQASEGAAVTAGEASAAAGGPAGGAVEPKKRAKKRRKGAKAAEGGPGEKEERTSAAAEAAEAAAMVVVQKPSFGRKKQREADQQYSLTRGVDLRGVSTVINADLPASIRDYVHRVGRCARGGSSGTAFTVCEESELPQLEQIIRSQSQAGAMSELKPLPLQIADAERFRYRVEDQARGLTKKSVLKYLSRELQLEALKSEKLKEYFEENPDEKKALQRSQRQLRDRRSVLRHLEAVPSYLVPESFDAATPVQQAVREDAAARGALTKRLRRRKMIDAKKRDPLQTFEPTGLPKSRPWLTREAMIAKDKRIDHSTANPLNLPPLSGRKIWKMRHNKKVNDQKDLVGNSMKGGARHGRARRRKFGGQ